MRGILIALAVVSTGAVAQQTPVFRAQSELVVLHAMVEDGDGAAVPELTADNFLVYEDNYPQKISFFSAADAPASIGLLIDNSTSMASKRERVVAAAVQFAGLSNPADEIFVLAFNEHVREVWAPRVIQESDASILRATLLQRIAARGKTALYDAVHGALDRLQHAIHTRQVLVIVSDGSDNASGSAQQQMLDRVQSSHAMIYTVMLRDPVDRDGNPRLMRRLAELTGGEMFSPRDLDEVPEGLAHIARDIRATYTLGYVPASRPRGDQMRSLRVVASKDGRPLKVRTRGGYLATGRGSSGQGGAGAR